MTEKTFLDRAAEYSYKELERVGGDPKRLDESLQTVAIIYSVQAIIDNGGFRYLFESDFPMNPSYSEFASAYRRIGSLGAAEKLEKAVAAFPFADPHLHQDKRLQYLETLDEDSEFVQWGDDVCGDENVWRNLEEYVIGNAASFPISIN